MADAAGSVNLPQVAALVRLRRERERRAVEELAALRRRKAEAEQARQAADQRVETEETVRQTSEQGIYRFLRQTAPLSPAGLERHCETIRNLSRRVAEASKHRETTTAALREADDAVEHGRTRLVAQVRDRRKWNEIEIRVQDTTLRHMQKVTERESEDDIELRYGRSP